MHFYIILELIYVVVFAIINFKTNDTEKLNKNTQSSYIVFLLFVLKDVFYPRIEDIHDILISLKASVLIGSFLFYATFYIIYLKDKDNIELAKRTLKFARINHFVCVALLAGILYYEFNFV